MDDDPTLSDIHMSLNAEQRDLLSQKIREARIYASLEPRQKVVFDLLVQDTTQKTFTKILKQKWSEIPYG